MSGLFNMVIGDLPPVAPLLFAMIGIDQQTKDIYPLGRFRYIHINAEADKIYILTRNYGQEYVHVDEAIAKNPNFIRKFSDSDPTYTSYEFSVPEKHLELAKVLASESDTRMPMDRYRKIVDDMRDGKLHPEHPAIIAGKKIAEALNQAMTTGGNVDLGDVQIVGGNPDA